MIDVLEFMNQEERQTLQAILGTGSSDPNAILSKLRRKAASLTGYCWGILWGTLPSYAKIVVSQAARLGLDQRGDTVEIEHRILEHMLGQLTPEEQVKLRERLIELARASNIDPKEVLTKAAISGGTIVLADASGFGVYLLASSLAGAISSALGITIPFIGYMALSGTIKVLTAPPPGWALLAAWLTLVQISI